MNTYELVVVFGGNTEDNERSAALEKVNGYITRYEGTITATDEMGKRTLAYPINNVTEGYYYVIKFEAPLSAPAEIENHVRIMEQVIRFLIVKQEA